MCVRVRVCVFFKLCFMCFFFITWLQLMRNKLYIKYSIVVMHMNLREFYVIDMSLPVTIWKTTMMTAMTTLTFKAHQHTHTHITDALK